MSKSATKTERFRGANSKVFTGDTKLRDYLAQTLAQWAPFQQFMGGDGARRVSRCGRSSLLARNAEERDRSFAVHSKDDSARGLRQLQVLGLVARTIGYS